MQIWHLRKMLRQPLDVSKELGMKQLKLMLAWSSCLKELKKNQLLYGKMAYTPGKHDDILDIAEELGRKQSRNEMI